MFSNVKVQRYHIEGSVDRIKVHNTVYLSDWAFHLHPEIGIHAANIAPEFAVAETRALLSLLKKHQLERELEKFIEISYSSRKWQKWMLNDSKLGKQEKAIISGHYIFGKNEFVDLKMMSKEKFL